MPASKAQQKAVNKYVKANYDLFQIKMPKGRKAEIQAAAAAAGESLNAYINASITQRMGGDASKSPTEAAGAPAGAGAVSLPFDTLKAAREAAEASGEALPVFVERAVETQAQRDSITRKMKKAPDEKSEA